MVPGIREPARPPARLGAERRHGVGVKCTDRTDARWRIRRRESADRRGATRCDDEARGAGRTGRGGLHAFVSRRGERDAHRDRRGRGSVAERARRAGMRADVAGVIVNRARQQREHEHHSRQQRQPPERRTHSGNAGVHGFMTSNARGWRCPRASSRTKAGRPGPASPAIGAGARRWSRRARGFRGSSGSCNARPARSDSRPAVRLRQPSTFQPGSRAMAELIRYEVRDAVATLTLNRPEKLNAFAEDMREQLVAALERVAAEGEARVLILTGAGRAFCAGGDVNHMASLKQRHADFRELKPLMELGRAVVTRIEALPFPTIAAVNGVAAGAGINLALACDLRVASDSASFGETFVRIGLHPDWGGTYYLPRFVGLARA